MSTTPSPQFPLPPPLVTDPFVPGWQLNHPPPAATNVPQHSESIQPPGTASSTADTNTAHLSAIDALSQTFSRLSLADGSDVIAHTAPPQSSPRDRVVRAPSPLGLNPARTHLPLLLTPTRPPPGFPTFVSPAGRLGRLRAAQRLLLTPTLSSQHQSHSPSNCSPKFPSNPSSSEPRTSKFPTPTPLTAAPATAVTLSPVRSIWREVDEVLDGYQYKGGYKGRWYGASHPVRREGRREAMERRVSGRV